MSKRNPLSGHSVYNYQNYNRPLTPYELTSVGEVSVLYEYHRLKQIKTPNLALQELLKRHDNLLQLIAKKAHENYDLSSDYEDKLQHARYAAMRAYEKFDIDRARDNRFRLYNFVCNSAALHLNTASDEDSFIKCNPIRRIIRSYLQGKYDTDVIKKFEVEQRLGVNTEEDKYNLRIKYIALISDFISCDVPCSDDEDESFANMFPDEKNINIDEKLHLLQLIECLTLRQQLVAKNCFIDGWSIRETASILHLNETQVRGDIQQIRYKLKSYVSREPTFF